MQIDLPREDLTCHTIVFSIEKGHAMIPAIGLVSKTLGKNDNDVHRVRDLPTAIIVMACLSSLSLAPPLVRITNLLV